MARRPTHTRDGRILPLHQRRPGLFFTAVVLGLVMLLFFVLSAVAPLLS